MCHIGTWSTGYCMRTAEKVWRSKVKKIWFAECQKITLGKSALCRVPRQLALGKEFKKTPLCRVPGRVALGKELKKLKKPLPSARSGALGKGGI